jgi:hypothetical protein
MKEPLLIGGCLTGLVSRVLGGYQEPHQALLPGIRPGFTIRDHGSQKIKQTA